jgi:hypothetical protein
MASGMLQGQKTSGSSEEEEEHPKTLLELVNWT